jgi:hypothetical protein
MQIACQGALHCCTPTSEKIAYMYTFKIMFDTSVIQTQDASKMYISV